MAAIDRLTNPKQRERTEKLNEKLNEAENQFLSNNVATASASVHNYSAQRLQLHTSMGGKRALMSMDHKLQRLW